MPAVDNIAGMADEKNDGNMPWLSLKTDMPVVDDMDYGDYNLDGILESEDARLDRNGQIGDYDDLDSIHRQVQAARLALYNATTAQSAAEKELVVAQAKAKRAWNRVYLSSQGADKIKSAMADIRTEKLTNAVLECQFRRNELQRKCMFLRDELRTLETLANDYRQMMRVRA